MYIHIHVNNEHALYWVLPVGPLSRRAGGPGRPWAALLAIKHIYVYVCIYIYIYIYIHTYIIISLYYSKV